MHTTPSPPPRASNSMTARVVAAIMALLAFGIGTFVVVDRHAAPRAEPPHITPRVARDAVADAGGARSESQGAEAIRPRSERQRNPSAGEPQAGNQYDATLGNKTAPREMRVRFRVQEVQGPIPEAAVERVVRGHLSTLQTCYAAATVERPDLGGRLAFTLRFDASGIPRSSLIESSSLESPALEACALAAIERWRFPASRRGEPTTVTFAVVFTNDPSP